MAQHEDHVARRQRANNELQARLAARIAASTHSMVWTLCLGRWLVKGVPTMSLAVVSERD